MTLIRGDGLGGGEEVYGGRKKARCFIRIAYIPGKGVREGGKPTAGVCYGAVGETEDGT